MNVETLFIIIICALVFGAFAGIVGGNVIKRMKNKKHNFF